VAAETAEDFTLKDQFGREFNLYRNLHQKILHIFYPKDNTPVCTKQLKDYQVNEKELISFGIIIVGINSDPEETHMNFTKKCGLNFPFLSDPGKKVCRQFNAVNLFGGIKRKLVLIGSDRKILFEDEVLSIKYRTSGQLMTLLSNL
jgi:peroxiredoxin Q/BCP